MLHCEALELTIAALPVGVHAKHSALFELCRVLAVQMDAAGDEPSTRLSAAYLSALKDVARIPERQVSKPGGKLALLRAQRPK